MSTRNFRYETCCVNANGQDISDMVDSSKNITWETLLKHVNIEEIEMILPNENPTLKKDWAVSFHKSKYQNKKCYYICHSAIEYVFVEDK